MMHTTVYAKYGTTLWSALRYIYLGKLRGLKEFYDIWSPSHYTDLLPPEYEVQSL
jgi:hypothetical protein